MIVLLAEMEFDLFEMYNLQKNIVSNITFVVYFIISDSSAFLNILDVTYLKEIPCF